MRRRARRPREIESRPSRLGIWLRTLAVLVVVAAAVSGLDWALLTRRDVDPLLAFALAFGVVQTILVIGLMAVILTRKVVRARRERRIRAYGAVARQRILDHLLGGEETRSVGDVYGRCPEAVERCVVELLASIAGSELARLTDLAERIGLVARWERNAGRRRVESRRRAVANLGRLAGERGNGILQSALEDPHGSVRVEAARALLRSGAIEDVERVFHLANEETLLVRAVLVEDLRSHASSLGEQAVPRVLASSRTRDVRIALEMIEAWQKSLPTVGLGALLRHPLPEIRARALRALPYASSSVDPEREAVAGLEDEDSRVRRAAAALAGRLRVEAAAEPLSELLQGSDPRLVLAAARALASLEAGRAILAEAATSGTGTAAVAAREALARTEARAPRLVTA